MTYCSVLFDLCFFSKAFLLRTCQNASVIVISFLQVCPAGSRLKGKGRKVLCGEGGDAKHKGCTADTPLATNISEYSMAQKMAQQMYEEDGILFSQICSDSDGAGKTAFQELLTQKRPDLEFQWLKDFWHINKSQKFHVKDHKFCKGTFGPGLNADQRKDRAKALAIDIVTRTSVTLRNAWKHWDDIEELKKSSDKLVKYMLSCYEGNHDKCLKSSLAQLTGCKGPSAETQRWITRPSSPFKPFQVDQITLGKTDKALLTKQINKKLGEGIDYLREGITTSHNESFNHTLWGCNQKNRTFAKNSSARSSAAVGQANNNLDEFYQMTAREAHCPLPDKGVGKKVLTQYENKRKRTRENQAKPSSIARTNDIKRQRVDQYFCEDFGKHDIHRYQTFKLDQANQVSDQATQDILDLLPQVPREVVEPYAKGYAQATAASKEYTHELSKVEPAFFDLDGCEAAIQKALQSCLHLKSVLSDSKDKMQQLEEQEKVKRKNMKKGAKTRTANKQKQCEQRKQSTTHSEHNYTKM